MYLGKKKIRRIVLESPEDTIWDYLVFKSKIKSLKCKIQILTSRCYNFHEHAFKSLQKLNFKIEESSWIYKSKLRKY